MALLLKLHLRINLEKYYLNVHVPTSGIWLSGRFIPMRTHDKKRTYDIIKVVPFISDEDRYEELTPFPLANLRHTTPVESCEVKVKVHFYSGREPYSS